MQQKRW